MFWRQCLDSLLSARRECTDPSLMLGTVVGTNPSKNVTLQGEFLAIETPSARLLRGSSSPTVSVARKSM